MGSRSRTCNALQTLRMSQRLLCARRKLPVGRSPLGPVPRIWASHRVNRLCVATSQLDHTNLRNSAKRSSGPHDNRNHPRPHEVCPGLATETGNWSVSHEPQSPVPASGGLWGTGYGGPGWTLAVDISKAEPPGICGQGYLVAPSHPISLLGF